MKKHIALLMALLILLSTVVSCGSSESSNTQTEAGNSSTEAVIPSENPENSSDQPVVTSQPEQTVTESPNTTNSPEQSSAEPPVTTNLPEQTSGQTEPQQTEPAIPEHVHSFGTEWKTDAYSHWHTCSCGENSQFAAHSFGEWVVAKAATEQVVGAEYRICATCGYKEEKTIPVLGHTHRFGTEWQSDDVKHWHVCECGEKTDNVSHSFGEWIVDTEATCTEAGSRHHVCSVCGKNVSEVIPAKGHTLVTDTGKPATCTEAGISDGRHCSVCQAVITAQKEIPAKGHTVLTDKAVAATCTADGVTEGSHCSVCNVVLKAQEKVNALGHNFVDGVCSRCGLEKCSEGLDYTKSSDGKSWIVSGIGTCKDTDIIIPAKYEGLVVSEIGEKAFADCTAVKNIAIPNSIKTIGTRAFYGCTEMSEITIPESVTKIGTQIFYKSNIETVYYYSAYYGWDNPFMQGIKKVYIGGKYVVWGPDTLLAGNQSIIELTVLNNVSGIYLAGCTNLTSVSLPEGLTSLTLSGCEKLKKITFPDSLLTLSLSDCPNLTNIIIPNGVTNLSLSCPGLTDISIPNSVTMLSLRGCTGLTSITIPNGVTNIGDFAFEGCRSLTNITIPDSIASIGDYAFEYCTSLTNITIPDSVSSIGRGAFGGCSSMTSIVIPDSVTSIGQAAFGLSGLTNITLPDSITRIENQTFNRCSNLKSIVIPQSITSIGDNIFFSFGGWSLSNIIYQGTMAQWKAIPKGAGWNSSTGDYSVICTDGTLTKEES